jgi:hypothetical protein
MWTFCDCKTLLKWSPYLCDLGGESECLWVAHHVWST